jgi:hypothetical protein
MSLEGFELQQQEYDGSVSSLSDDAGALMTGVVLVLAAGGQEDTYLHEENTNNQGDNETLCQCEQVYQDSGNEKIILYFLCIGLKCDDNVPLFSFDYEPCRCIFHRLHCDQEH